MDSPDTALVEPAGSVLPNGSSANDPNINPPLHDGTKGALLPSQEDLVGITAFVSPHLPGFECTIKHRYTDFLVNEISPEGEVIHLTQLSPSRRPQTPGVAPYGDALHGEDAATSATKCDSRPSKRKAIEEELETEANAVSEAKRPRIGQSAITESDPSPAISDAPATKITEDLGAMSTEQRKENLVSSVPETDQQALRGIFGEAVTERVLKLYASVLLRPDRKPRDLPRVESEPIGEKSKRTEAHVAIRRIFSSKLETLTMQDQPGVILIKAAPTKRPSGGRSQLNDGDPNSAHQKGKLGWTELGGEYLHFSLYKENKDTMEVLFFIASQIKVSIKNFQFAGTKDRRGVTVQRVAILRVHAERIARLNRGAKGWRAGNFEYKPQGLDLGDLGGNEFLLTLRDCLFDGSEHADIDVKLDAAKCALAKASESFKQDGFLNYFGLQRFGTYSTGTHSTGQQLLQGDLEGAIDSILAYSDEFLPENQDATNSKKVPQDDISRASAIRAWRSTGDVSEVVSKMPRRFQAEASIMQYLSKKDRKSGRKLQERDWQGALMQIQRNLRLMYVHAYQSFVWNTVVGKRWELYGNEVVEGDLVIVGEKDEDTGPAKTEVDDDGEAVFHPAEDDSAPLGDDPFTRARPLTKAEVESGKYNVFDIVLPLPGFDVSYPANEIGEFYKTFMASEAGGGLDPHNMRRSWKDISLSGGYRKMMARPGNDFGFEVRKYVDDGEQMVETDLERLEGSNRQTAAGTIGQGGDKSKIAVVLKMQLGSSQYATVALRELTKGGAANFRPDYSTR